MSENIIKQKNVSKLDYKSESFSDLFSHIKIQTNNVCTRKCNFCYYGNKLDEKLDADVLSSEVVYKVLDELSELKFDGRLSFFEINEPLTDKRIFDFIAYAKKKIPLAWQMLITNGDLLTSDIINNLFSSGLNKLYISVYDSKSMEKISKTVGENIENNKNIEIMDLRSEKFVDNRGGHLDNYNEADKIDKFLIAPCEKLYKIMNIRPSGNVVSCSADFYEDNILGNIYEEGVKEIWFGEKYRNFRKHLDNCERDFSSLCLKCNYKGSGGYFSK